MTPTPPPPVSDGEREARIAALPDLVREAMMTPPFMRSTRQTGIVVFYERATQAEAERDRALAEITRLRGSGNLFLQQLDTCKQIERGAGGMTIEAQISRSHLLGVRAVWIEDFRAAIAATSEPEDRT